MVAFFQHVSALLLLRKDRLQLRCNSPCFPKHINYQPTCFQSCSTAWNLQQNQQNSSERPAVSAAISASSAALCCGCQSVHALALLGTLELSATNQARPALMHLSRPQGGSQVIKWLQNRATARMVISNLHYGWVFHCSLFLIFVPTSWKPPGFDRSVLGQNYPIYVSLLFALVGVLLVCLYHHVTCMNYGDNVTQQTRKRTSAGIFGEGWVKLPVDVSNNVPNTCRSMKSQKYRSILMVCIKRFLQNTTYKSQNQNQYLFSDSWPLTSQKSQKKSQLNQKTPKKGSEIEGALGSPPANATRHRAGSEWSDCPGGFFGGSLLGLSSTEDSCCVHAWVYLGHVFWNIWGYNCAIITWSHMEPEQISYDLKDAVTLFCRHESICWFGIV